MVDNNPLQTFTPTEAAEMVGAGAHSIRRWAEWHSPHLSQGANPAPGAPRRFTGRDLEVLKHVKALREQGLQTLAINEQLTRLTFAEIDTQSQPVETPAALNPLPTGQESPSAAQFPIMVLNDLENRFSAKFAALEQTKEEVKRSRQRDTLIYLLGFASGIVLAVGLLAVAALMLGR